MSVYDDIKGRAHCMVFGDGKRDVEHIFEESFELETYDYYSQWELLKGLFTPEEFFNMHYEEIHDHVKEQVLNEIEDMVEKAMEIEEAEEEEEDDDDSF